MKQKMNALLFWFALAITGCTGVPNGLVPVNDFDLNRYLGTWYEIARLDHRFERNMTDVSATYSRKDSNFIHVLNKGFDTEKHTWKQVQGRARFQTSDDIGSLKVSFFGPFYGGYHIIALDRTNYQYAMVSGPSRSYLWILARQKMLDDTIYNQLVAKASAWGFNTAQLIRVEHREND